MYFCSTIVSSSVYDVHLFNKITFEKYLMDQVNDPKNADITPLNLYKQGLKYKFNGIWLPDGHRSKFLAKLRRIRNAARRKPVKKMNASQKTKPNPPKATILPIKPLKTATTFSFCLFFCNACSRLFALIINLMQLFFAQPKSSSKKVRNLLVFATYNYRFKLESFHFLCFTFLQNKYRSQLEIDYANNLTTKLFTNIFIFL